MKFIKRWICWFVVVGLIATVICHGPLLRGVANPLIVDDPVEQCDSVVVLSGDQAYAVAAKLVAQKQAREIILLKTPIKPLVRYQILKPQHETHRAEIVKRGVPENVINIALEPIHSLWDAGDEVRARLKAEPTERITVLSDRFHSHRLRWVLARTLTEQQLEHVRIVAIPDRRFDETNRRRHRHGLKAVVDAYVRHLHTSLAGRPPRFTPPVTSPEELKNRFALTALMITHR